MKKYRVAIILLRKRFHFIHQLEALFGKYIEFFNYSVEEGIKPYINCDLALVPSQEVAERVRKYLLPQTKMLVVRRTMSCNAWKLIHSIPANTKVLVVNTYWQMAIQTISSLYELGVTHLELIPYSSVENNNYDDIDYAITTNETAYVPKHISHIVDIGTRLVDISSLFDILNKLNLLNAETLNILRMHEKEMIPLSSGFVNMFNHFQQTNEEFDVLLNMLEDGVMTFDADFRVKIYNQPIIKFLHQANSTLSNSSLDELFDKQLAKFIRSNADIHNEFICINNNYYLLSKSTIYKNSECQGGFILLRRCENIEHQNLKISRILHRRGHIAKYTFSYIKGQNHSLMKTINLSKKAAASNSDILIEGESGTGKELFVQSIHNASKRHDEPFIAFNCAALTGSLLESEIFGYEEGAFTGANRHGKAGLFEIADKGTIFLDEISEIPLDFQVKLLRVLQEREFIRVGGTKTIPINVRVIAATNQNLYSLVQQKKFRMDLYFRLNVFNIKIPPLRERSDDIPLLVEYFLREKDIKTDFPFETMQVFLEYEWPGNVRELKNCLEYMINLDEGFGPENLPEHIKMQLADMKRNVQKTGNLAKSGCLAEEIALLELLHDASQQKVYVGRRKLAEELSKQAGFISEQSIRTMLNRLEKLGMVSVSRGRIGTRLTLKGIAYLTECHAK